MTFLFDYITGQKVVLDGLPLQQNICEILGSGSTRLLAFASPQDSTIRLWDVETNSLVGTLADAKKSQIVVNQLFSWEYQNCLFLVSGYSDGSIALWSVALSGAFSFHLLKRSPRISSNTETLFAFNPIERVLTSIHKGEKSCSTMCWDIYTLQSFSKKKLSHSNVQSAFSFHHPGHHSNTILLSLVNDPQIYVMDSMDEKKDGILYPIIDTNTLPTSDQMAPKLGTSSTKGRSLVMTLHPLYPHLMACFARSGVYLISLYPSLATEPSSVYSPLKICMVDREKFHSHVIQSAPTLKIAQILCHSPAVPISIARPGNARALISPSGQFLSLFDKDNREYWLFEASPSPDIGWDPVPVHRGSALAFAWSPSGTQNEFITARHAEEDDDEHPDKHHKKSKKSKSKKKSGKSIDSAVEGVISLILHHIENKKIIDSQKVKLPVAKNVEFLPAPLFVWVCLTQVNLQATDPGSVYVDPGSMNENFDPSSSGSSCFAADSVPPSPYSTSSLMFRLSCFSWNLQEMSDGMTLCDPPHLLVWEKETVHRLSLMALCFSGFFQVIIFHEGFRNVCSYPFRVNSGLWVGANFFFTTDSEVLMCSPLLPTVMPLTLASFFSATPTLNESRLPNLPKKLDGPDLLAEPKSSSSSSAGGSPSSSGASGGADPGSDGGDNKSNKRWSIMGPPKSKEKSLARRKAIARSQMTPNISLSIPVSSTEHEEKLPLRPLESLSILTLDSQTDALTLFVPGSEPSFFTISLATNWEAKFYMLLCAGAAREALHCLGQLKLNPEDLEIYALALAHLGYTEEALSLGTPAIWKIFVAMNLSLYKQAYQILLHLSRVSNKKEPALSLHDINGLYLDLETRTLSNATLSSHSFHQWALWIGESAFTAGQNEWAEKCFLFAEQFDPTDYSLRVLISFYVKTKNFEALEGLLRRLIEQGESDSAQFAAMFLEEETFQQSLLSVAHPSLAAAYLHHFSIILGESNPQYQVVFANLERCLARWNEQLTKTRHFFEA